MCTNLPSFSSYAKSYTTLAAQIEIGGVGVDSDHSKRQSNGRRVPGGFEGLRTSRRGASRQCDMHRGQGFATANRRRGASCGAPFELGTVVSISDAR
jgi:hypothetical protein